MSYYWMYWYPDLLDPDQANMTYDTNNLENFQAPFLGPEYKAKEIIYKYVFAVLLFLGSVGTVPCLILLNRYSHTVWSASIYVSLLFGTDLVRLYVHCGNDWFIEVNQQNLSWDILIISNSICKVYSFIFSFINHMSSWIVVALAIELLIAVRFPRHMYRMCTRERAQAVILLIIVILICLNLHFFWTIGLSMPGQTPELTKPFCHHNHELSQEFQAVILPLIDFLVKEVIPLIIISVCLSICLFHMFTKSRHREDELESLLGKYFLDLKTLYSLKMSTLLMLACFLVNCGCQICFTIITHLFSDHYFANYVALETVKHLSNYTYLSLKPYIFIILCKKIQMDACFFFKCMVGGKEQWQNKQNMRNQNARTSESIEEGQTITQPHHFVPCKQNSAGARPKIYKATGIGTSTGV